MNENTRKRTISGKVSGKCGNKSVAVLVERKVLHPKYRKIVRRFKKYIIHDERNESVVGDFVEAIECAPLSKNKSFVLNKILTRN